MSRGIENCPYHKELNAAYKPFDLTDPFPFYKKVRETCPIFYSEELGYYVVSKYEDIKAIFGNWQAFSSENAQSPSKPIAQKAKALMDSAGLVGLSGLSGRIPPDHTRIRRIVSMAFNLARIKKLEPAIREIAIRMIEEMKDGKSEAELVSALAYDLPALVIFKLLGVPDSDVDQVKSWAESRLLLTWGDLDEDAQMMHAENMIRYWNYCQKLVSDRKTTMQDDLAGDLVTLQAEGHEITDREIAAICYSQLFAGHETTTSLIGNGVRELLVHRESWAAIKIDPTWIPKAVDEILRYSPSILSWRRKCKAATEVGGVLIPEGADVLMVMGSGNRDEAMYENGESFNIERPNAATHLSFGSGIHFCLGSPLAKLEFKVVLEELTARIPTLQLKPGQTFSFAPNTSFRAPQGLQVQW
ncbi:MAG: cytochrome P450 [Flavobacteriales bacterium]|nr:cytochrome P450 [Flavobacteriales bacterium]